MTKLTINDFIDIYVEEDNFLLSPYYKQQLAIYLVELGLSRHGTTRWLMDVIYGHMEDGGKIYNGEGDEIYLHPDIIEDAYFDDTSHCWNTDVKRFALAMPKRRSSDRLILRLQLFDATLRAEGHAIERPTRD